MGGDKEVHEECECERTASLVWAVNGEGEGARSVRGQQGWWHRVKEVSEKRFAELPVCR